MFTFLTNWGLYFGAEGVERWKVKTTEYNGVLALYAWGWGDR